MKSSTPGYRKKQILAGAILYKNKVGLNSLAEKVKTHLTLSENTINLYELEKLLDNVPEPIITQLLSKYTTKVKVIEKITQRKIVRFQKKAIHPRVKPIWKQQYNNLRSLQILQKHYVYSQFGYCYLITILYVLDIFSF